MILAKFLRILFKDAEVATSEENLRKTLPILPKFFKGFGKKQEPPTKGLFVRRRRFWGSCFLLFAVGG